MFGATETFVLKTCPKCEGPYRDWLEPERRCRCAEARTAASETLKAIDPDGRMRLDSLTRPDPTLAQCVELGRRVAAGERRRGLLMVGEPGRGKTHLMVGLLRLALEHGRLACWHNVIELVHRVQDTYSRDWIGPNRSQIVENICSYQLVLLDDLGKERDSEDVQTLLYELIDGLYQRRRSVVISTNLSIEQYAERYDPAIRSRLKEMCNTLAVAGEDRRRKGGGGFYEQEEG